ncbi:hypothetical protein Tco_1488570, partial [Tanacetum coccineum]
MDEDFDIPAGDEFMDDDEIESGAPVT